MKIGAAHVAGLYTVPTGSGTQFMDGVNAIFNLGLRTLKIYCTQNYATDYPLQTVWSAAPTNCVQLLQTTQFQSALALDWDTIVFTMFSFANPANNWWRTGVPTTSLDAEYTEIYNAAVHLLTTYNNTGKTFIISHWEGDWAFMDSFIPSTPVPRRMIEYFTSFLATRQRAVADARRDTAHVNVSVQHAVEVNRIIDGYGTSSRRRILKDVCTRMKPDLISYSAYDSTIVDQGGWGATQADWVTATTEAFTRALRTIKSVGVPFYIGEFGYPENEAEFDFTPPRDVAEMVRVTYEIALAQGATHFIFWECFDNEPSIPYTYRGYWLRRPDGSLSYTGAELQALNA